MDSTGLKRHYGAVSDDELLRLWAEQDDLTEAAVKALSDEISMRGLTVNTVQMLQLHREAEERSTNFRRAQEKSFRLIGKLLLKAAVIVAATVLVFWAAYSRK
jgi:hypothetical protein